MANIDITSGVTIAGLPDAEGFNTSFYLPVDASGSAVRVKASDFLGTTLSNIRGTTISGSLLDTNGKAVNVNTTTGLILTGSILNARYASASVVGVAKFDSDHFSVNVSGLVSLNDVPGSSVGSGISATNITIGTLPITRIEAGAITSAKLALNSAAENINSASSTTTINGTKITDNSITRSKLENDAKTDTIYIQLVGDGVVPTTSHRAYFSIPAYMNGRNVVEVGITTNELGGTPPVIKFKNGASTIYSLTGNTSIAPKRQTTGLNATSLSTNGKLGVEITTAGNSSFIDVWFIIR